jgi:hypothetical protein
VRVPLRAGLLPLLRALDLCAVVVLPIALAMIAIFYGLWVLGMPRRLLFLSLLALCCVTASALPIKGFLRVALYNNQPFVARVCATAQTSVPLTNNVGPAISNCPHLAVS